MLGKLLKHEFKATYRIFIPIYIGLAILIGAACIFLQLFDKFDQAIVVIASGFGMIIAIFGLLFVFISPYIFLSMRFYRTTATREAYLTFTVPADTKAILLSKFIVAYVWTVITIFLGYLSIGIVVASGGNNNILDMFKFLFDDLSLDTILQIISLLLGFATTVLHIFTSISLGQLVRDHRVIASLAFYVAIYTIQQIVSVIVLMPFMISEMSATESSVGFTIGFAEAANTSGTADTSIFIISILTSLVFAVVFYFLSNFILKKKLNLL